MNLAKFETETFLCRNIFSQHRPRFTSQPSLLKYSSNQLIGKRPLQDALSTTYRLQNMYVQRVICCQQIFPFFRYTKNK
jgi:hypothetical protein